MVSSSVVRTITAASVLPAAFAVASFSSSCSFRFRSSRFPAKSGFPLPASLLSSPTARSFNAAADPIRPNAAFQMESVVTDVERSNQHHGALPELVTEFMVDMTCEGCVSAVKNALQKLEGIKGIEVDLSNQVVRVLASLPVKTMLDTLELTGRSARLIGQGNPNDYQISAAVAEFKGPVIFGVIRFAQLNMELARIEAGFSGLSPGRHAWSINEYGDLTRGVASTGNVFNPQNQFSQQVLGDLGTLEASENGEAQFYGSKEKLRVSELIGRSVAIYEEEDRSDAGVAAAVVARSAGVGENYKRLCTCDGVTIWESN